MIVAILETVWTRVAAFRTYRQTIADIEAMSDRELACIHAADIEGLGEARRRFFRR